MSQGTKVRRSNNKMTLIKKKLLSSKAQTIKNATNQHLFAFNIEACLKTRGSEFQQATYL